MGAKGDVGVSGCWDVGAPNMSVSGGGGGFGRAADEAVGEDFGKFTFAYALGAMEEDGVGEAARGEHLRELGLGLMVAYHGCEDNRI